LNLFLPTSIWQNLDNALLRVLNQPLRPGLHAARLVAGFDVSDTGRVVMHTWVSVDSK
jgi:hypothetical protein